MSLKPFENAFVPFAKSPSFPTSASLVPRGLKVPRGLNVATPLGLPMGGAPAFTAGELPTAFVPAANYRTQV